MLKKWDDLPECMKNESVRRYYGTLHDKRFALIIKRLFDIAAGVITLVILSPFFLIISIAIKIDSKGPVFFRQVRVTQYGKHFRIFKFRTMIADAENIGTQVTTKNDRRITKVGRLLRKFRLDEIPQLLNIIAGDMSFVGTRPEVVKYVDRYTDEMMATMLLPAGVTSEASIHYKDEEHLLASAGNADDIYVNVVLPEKMKYNLRNMKEYSFCGELKTMLMTVLAVVKRDKDSEIDGIVAVAGKDAVDKESINL